MFRTKRKCRNHKHPQGSALKSGLQPKIYTSATLTEAEPGTETLTETTKGQTRRTPARWTSISDPGQRPGSRPWCELPGTSWRRRPYSCKDYRRPVTHRVQLDDQHCQTRTAWGLQSMLSDSFRSETGRSRDEHIRQRLNIPHRKSTLFKYNSFDVFYYSCHADKKALLKINKK